MDFNKLSVFPFVILVTGTYLFLGNQCLNCKKLRCSGRGCKLEQNKWITFCSRVHESVLPPLGTDYVSGHLNNSIKKISSLYS